MTAKLLADWSSPTVDVKQPTAPKVLWSAKTPLVYKDAETVMPLGKDRLLVGTRDLFLFDVSDPVSPKQLGAIRDRARVDFINGFARFGETVFGANKEGHVMAIDLSGADTIKVLGFHETREAGELGSPHDAAFCGELLVIVSPKGFGSKSRPGRLGVYRVVDEKSHKVLPPEQRSLIGRLEHPRLAGANRVMTGGKFAYVGSSLAAHMESDENRVRMLSPQAAKSVTVFLSMNPTSVLDSIFACDRNNRWQTIFSARHSNLRRIPVLRLR